MRKTFIFLTILIILACGASGVYAQSGNDSEAFARGTLAAENGNFRLALMYYENALESLDRAALGSENYEAKIQYNLGACHFRLGDFAEAVAHLKQAVRLSNRQYQKAFYALGMAYVEMSDQKLAKDAFLSAVALKKDDAEAWFDLALVFLSEKRYDEAAKAFRAAIKSDTNSSSLAASHNNLGVILAFGGDTTLAEKEFQTAVTQSGGNLPVATQNLEILRAFLEKRRPELLAKLEINKREKSNDEVTKQ